MEMKTIGIYHRDGEYAKAMAERLCLKLRGVRIEVLSCVPPGQKEVYVMEQYVSASKAADDISAAFGIKKQPEQDKNCVLTGFTAGAGGSGATSAALALGHIYAELYGYKTLYLSFDMLAVKSGLAVKDSLQQVYSLVYGKEEQARESLFARDSRGLYFLGSEGIINPLSFLDSAGSAALFEKLSGCFERIVADIPFRPEGADVLDLCDNAVVCFGWQQERFFAGEALLSYLKGMRDRVFDLRPLFDEYGTDDICGQFGSEVRALAQQIEKG